MRYEDSTNDTLSCRSELICSMIKDYICDVINYDKTISVLKYWKEKEKRWECLAKVAKKY